MVHDNINISRLMVHAKKIEETRLRRNNTEAKKAWFYEGCLYKARLDIQDKLRFKKRLSNQVPSKFPKARDDRVSNPNSQKVRGTSYQLRSQLMESVGRNIMVIALSGQTLSLVMERVATRLRISKIWRGKTKEAGKFKIVVLMLMLQRRITFIHFAQRVKKRVL